MLLRRHVSAICVLAALFLLAALTPASAQTLPFWLKIEKVMNNTADLGNLVQSPTGEIWLLERTTGAVKVFWGGQQMATLTVPVTITCQAGVEDAAFAQDYAATGLAFVYYVNSSNHAVVDRVTRGPGSALTLGTRILDLGAVTDDCRPGGGLMVGKDGKLYVSVGDLGLPGEAQSDASLVGKVLRVNPDGTAPADNPTPGSLVWAKGFRNGKGLAYNPDSARLGGTFYLADIGSASAPTAYDELNAVRAGGNYAWNLGSGPYGGYDLPLISWASTALVNPDGLAALHHPRLGSEHQNSLVYAAPTNDTNAKGTVRELPLSGPDADIAGTERNLFKPDGDLDGTPDAACPTKTNAVAMGGDGDVYLSQSSTGANTGIWRIWRDEPGPREVSHPGSPFQFLVERQNGAGTSLMFRWENLGSLDAGRAKRYPASGDRAETYRIYEGTLPIDSDADGEAEFSHAGILDTNGDATGEAPGRLHASISNAGSGNRYYLVGAQGDNLEGTLGKSSAGAARTVPGTLDYCDIIGWANGQNIGKCFTDFKNGDGSVLKLIDYNPKSPTFNQAVSLEDFRGRVIRVDLSALDCPWCYRQTRCFDAVEKKVGDLDAVLVTIMMQHLSYWDAIPPANCASQIAAWQAAYGGSGPILCDVDLNADGGADAAHQLAGPCGGVPENFYLDQGQVQYKYVCGAEDWAEPGLKACSGLISVSLAPEVNPETCD